jgi:hypothetical protein
VRLRLLRFNEISPARLEEALDESCAVFEAEGWRIKDLALLRGITNSDGDLVGGQFMAKIILPEEDDEPKRRNRKPANTDA